MRRKQKVPEKNYLEDIFNSDDYESPEEKAVRSAEHLPNKKLFKDGKEDKI